MRWNAIFLAALVGCNKSDGSNKSGIDGVWLVQLPFDDTFACDETVTHNFTEGYLKEDDTESVWTQEEDQAYSDQLFFVQIETLNDSDAILIIDGDVYPGVSTDSGWSFTWLGSENASDSLTHETGYTYSATTSASSDVTISMTFDGNTATGTWASSTTSNSAWTESDDWEPLVQGEDGQIPSFNYLVYDLTDGKNQTTGIPLTNTMTSTDCSGDCELTVSTTCSGSVEFSATHTGFEDESTYNYLDGVGQPYGN